MRRSAISSLIVWSALVYHGPNFSAAQDFVGTTTQSSRSQSDADEASGIVIQRFANHSNASPDVATVYPVSENGASVLRYEQRQPWTVRVGLLLMNRTNPKSRPLFLNNGGVTVVDTGGLDFSTQPGVEVLVIKPLDDCWSAYGRYFWIEEFTASSSADVPSGGSVSIATEPLTTYSNDISTNHSLSLSCELQSAELGLRREVKPCLFVSGAFRWLRLNEHLRDELILNDDGSITEGSLDYQANNELFGFQLGLDGRKPVNSWLEFDYFGNAGVYHNSARVSGTFDLNAPTPQTLAGSRDWTAFVGEVGLGAFIHLRENISIHGGYRVLWIDGVALSHNQIAGSPAFGSTMPITPDMTTAIFHGADVSLEIRF